MEGAIEKTTKIALNITGDPVPFTLPKPFRQPVSICITGTTGAGKTSWIYKFLQNLSEMFENETPKQVLYCYGIFQELFTKMEKEFDFITFHEGIPNKETVFALTAPSMIILDDLCHLVCQSTDMELLFSQVSHHRNISVCLMKNNLFYQGKSARTISLNTNIYVLMKNPADLMQIRVLAKRVFPKNANHMIEAYDFATAMNNGKGYLILDVSAIPTIDIILKTDIFPGEEMILFKE